MARVLVRMGFLMSGLDFLIISGYSVLLGGCFIGLIEGEERCGLVEVF